MRFSGKGVGARRIVRFLSRLSRYSFYLSRVVRRRGGDASATPSCLVRRVLSGTNSNRIRLTQTTGGTSHGVRLLRCDLRATTNIVITLLLLFDVPGLSFASLRRSASSRASEVLPRRRDNELCRFAERLKRGVNSNADSFVGCIDSFSDGLVGKNGWGCTGAGA